MKKLLLAFMLTIFPCLNAQITDNSDGTSATGSYSVAMGYNTTASGDQSTAMGRSSTASGARSTAMGYNTTASGINSTAIGRKSVASGYYSTTLGYDTRASDFTSTVIGQYNNSLSSITTNGSATSYDADNTAFVIGNGTDDSNRSDAFKVMFNGDATISNDLTVSGDVVISSDARLKSNIVSLGRTLAKILQIDGKSYTMKKDESEKQKIGLLAQDIEKVFPDLVSESNGIKSVNYQGLVPVLINALKEQDDRISNQQIEIDELRNMLKALIEKP